MDERTAAVIITAASVLAAIIITRYIERRRRRRMFREAEMILDSFRGEFTVSCPSVEVSDKDADRINRQLKRIAGLLHHIREHSEAEKEETRAVVTDISHQLKTPVAVMKMSLELLRDESLSERERIEFLERFTASVNELETLMNSLVQISRMETGLIELRRTRTPVEDTVRNAVSCIIGKAEEKDISIGVEDAEDALSYPLNHDSRWLSEAIINVLDNSIKYSPKGSSIIISVSMRPGFVRIEIADTGIGIPREEYNKAMTRFYRGSRDEVANQKGSGVGLYLVSKIIRMHGGTVTIKPGRGTSPEYPGTVILMQIPK